MSDATLPQDEVLFQSWDDLGLPEEGPAEIMITSSEVKTINGKNGPFEKVYMSAEITARANGGLIGEEFQTSFTLDPRYIDNFRNLVKASGVTLPKGQITRQHMHEVAKALEGISLWTNIVNREGKDGVKRTFIGFKYADSLANLLG